MTAIQLAIIGPVLVIQWWLVFLESVCLRDDVEWSLFNHWDITNYKSEYRWAVYVFRVLLGVLVVVFFAAAGAVMST